MTSDTAFVGPVPALYDRHLGPFLFQPYAEDLAERAARLNPARVLEIAAGTGIVTTALCRTLPDATSIVATDLNQAMLDHAAARLEDGRVRWQQADAASLPFPDESFDLLVCQFGVMFFPDKARGYREALRVLRPGGRYLFLVWDELETNEAARLVSDAVAATFPDDPPTFVGRTPHGYHRIDEILESLESAGFEDIGVETIDKHGRAPSHRDPALGFCLGSPLRAEIEARDPARLDEAVANAAGALRARFGEGPIEAPMRAYLLTAARP